MSFDVAADAYDRFMGRYSRLLAPQMADFAGVVAGQRVLDVGSGPGALTTVLVTRTDTVAAVDPSASFVAALRSRFPDVEAAQAPAEALPFPDGVFDATLAQLVVNFMADPASGLAEMIRVTRPGGVIVACVWDLAGARSPLAVFWDAARAVDPSARDESQHPGGREGQLVALLTTAGLQDVTGVELEVPFGHERFEEWWAPFTLGVGPAGQYLSRLGEDARAAIREHARSLYAQAPRAVAWTARGIVAA